jgi:hypothetical protein
MLQCGKQLHASCWPSYKGALSYLATWCNTVQSVATLYAPNALRFGAYLWAYLSIKRKCLWLQSLRSDEGKGPVLPESLESSGLPAGMVRFLFNAAVAENLTGVTGQQAA